MASPISLRQRAGVLSVLRATLVCVFGLSTVACRGTPTPASRPPAGELTATLSRRSITVLDPEGRPTAVAVTMAFTGDTVRRRPLPLVVSLHYSGPDTLPAHYGASLLERVVLPALAPLGAVFVAPDAPDRGWGSPRSEAMMMAVLDSVAAHYPIDARRTLVTGYSLGGMGTWYLASRHPDRFRAAIPMASLPVLTRDTTRTRLLVEIDGFIDGSDTSWARSLQRVSWMVLQSRADATMPFGVMERYTRRLAALGVDVTFVPYDSITHKETVRYREPLRRSLPWIRRAWAR